MNEDLSGHHFSTEHRGPQRVRIPHRSGTASQPIPEPHNLGGQIPGRTRRTRRLFGCALLVFQRSQKRLLFTPRASPSEARRCLVQSALQHVWQESRRSFQRLDDSSARSAERALYARDLASSDGHRRTARRGRTPRRLIPFCGGARYADASVGQFGVRADARLSKNPE